MKKEITRLSTLKPLDFICIQDDKGNQFYGIVKGCQKAIYDNLPQRLQKDVTKSSLSRNNIFFIEIVLFPIKSSDTKISGLFKEKAEPRSEAFIQFINTNEEYSQLWFSHSSKEEVERLIEKEKSIQKDKALQDYIEEVKEIDEEMNNMLKNALKKLI